MLCAASKSARERSVEHATAVVTLRRATPDDATILHAWRAEPSARRYQPLHQLPRPELRRQLAERAAIPLNAHAEGKLQWVIEAGATPVGWLSLTITSREHGIGAVGYTIGERWRGRGYATAAVLAALPLAFSPTALALARLEAVAAIDNLASRRVLERAGFQFEGIARGYLVIGAHRVDHARYSLLRSDVDPVTFTPPPVRQTLAPS